MPATPLNLPQVHAEVCAAFARYEDALVHNRLEVLDELFWEDGRTIRFGIAENLYGIEAIRAFRSARPAAGLARRLQRTVITTFGTDFATAMTEFVREGGGKIGRQSQTWVRFEQGWRVVAAHVSLIDAPGKGSATATEAEAGSVASDPSGGSSASSPR